MQQLGKILVAIIFAAIGYGVVQYLMGNSPFGPRQPTRAEMTEILLDVPDVTVLHTLHDRAPEEFEKIVTRTMELVASGQTDLAYAEGQRVAVDIRRSRADDLWKAPSASVSRVLTTNADLYEVLADDPGRCAGVVVMGPAALDVDFVMANVVEINKTADAVFNAVFDGADAGGAPIRPPTDGQIDVVLASWGETLTDPGLMEGLTNPHGDNPRTCAAYIDFFRFLAAQTDPVTDQVRRQIVVDMAKS